MSTPAAPAATLTPCLVETSSTVTPCWFRIATPLAPPRNVLASPEHSGRVARRLAIGRLPRRPCAGQSAARTGRWAIAAVARTPCQDHREHQLREEVQRSTGRPRPTRVGVVPAGRE